MTARLSCRCQVDGGRAVRRAGNYLNLKRESPVSLSRLGVFAAATLLTGCSMLTQPRPADLSPELQTAFDTPLYCTGEKECKLMWERAIYFVSTSSRWPLISQTNNLIETEGVPKDYYGLAYSIVREPMGEGRYRIATQAWCGLPAAACRPHADEGVARAKLYMRTGQK